MKKLRLLGIEKSPKHSHYTFPKTQEIFSVIRGLLKELGVAYYVYQGVGVKDYDEETFNPKKFREENIKDKKYIDYRVSFKGKGNYTEVIFGKSKVFIMIHTELDMQQRISKYFNRYVDIKASENYHKKEYEKKVKEYQEQIKKSKKKRR